MHRGVEVMGGEANPVPWRLPAFGPRRAVVDRPHTTLDRIPPAVARIPARKSVPLVVDSLAPLQTCRVRPSFNDPSAGSPTETLLRLLLPLNDQV